MPVPRLSSPSPGVHPATPSAAKSFPTQGYLRAAGRLIRGMTRRPPSFPARARTRTPLAASLTGTAVVAAILGLAPAPPAQSAPPVTTVQLISGQLVLVDAPFGQDDVIGLVLRQVPAGGRVFDVVDPSHQVAAVAPCFSVDSHRVSCPDTGLTSWHVNSRDGDDLVTNFADLPGTVYAGDGDDEVLDGPNRQYVDLGPGNDHAVPGSEPDEIWGGSGIDLASYRRTARLCVTLDDDDNDGNADDGSSTCHQDGGDNIHSDVENLEGGSGNDDLWGSDGDNVIIGGAGEDALVGRAGNDTFPQTPTPDGRDRIYGDGVVFDQGGVNTVTYATRTSPVVAEISDDLPCPTRAARASLVLGCRTRIDGAPRVLPDLPDVPLLAVEDELWHIRTVVGTPYADILLGNATPNRLLGRGGADTLEGRAGADLLRGQGGDDVMRGQADDDRLIGAAGADAAYGGPGTDVCRAEITKNCP